ncbi:MAG TPA: 1-acyl-sn-glycerol-3-phosphate acyltransferase [Mycobacteriales bacterium]|nr:1-acyl-sn-glycerol-3-phosphate acyltransferase [Mycobacteriales bacterium]
MNRWVRRLTMVPLVVLTEIGILLTAPLSLLVGGIASLALRSSRPVRSVLLVVAYAAIELSTLMTLQRGVDDWDELVRVVLDRGYHAMRRSLDVTVRLEEGSPTREQLAKSKGVIVLARHCGPGDSLFIAWLLAVHYRLRLRIVLKQLLRLNPTVDLAGDHLPLCFVRPGGSRALNGITDLAGGLSSGDSLLLFPEGGNFTWPRWHAAIESLSRRGELIRARRARMQTHTLPARPGGALAALGAAPDADVLLLAHSGLSDDGRDRPWWRVPIHQELLIRTVLVPAAAVPRDDAGARAFLDRAWSQVDTWVEGHADLLELAADQAP